MNIRTLAALIVAGCAVVGCEEKVPKTEYDALQRQRQAVQQELNTEKQRSSALEKEIAAKDVQIVQEREVANTSLQKAVRDQIAAEARLSSKEWEQEREQTILIYDRIGQILYRMSNVVVICVLSPALLLAFVKLYTTIRRINNDRITSDNETLIKAIEVVASMNVEDASKTKMINKITSAYTQQRKPVSLLQLGLSGANSKLIEG